MGKRRLWNGVLVAGIALGLGAGACGDVTSDSSDHVKVEAQKCVTCHLPDYQNAKAPPHVDALPTDCAKCHTEKAWSPATFVHSWPLVGVHATLVCQNCHVGDPPKYVGTSRLCYGCHQKDYEGSPYPGHQTFPTTCENCHSQVAWKPASPVEHPWPLLGAHSSAPCSGCHVGNPPVYKGTPKICSACHIDDYNSSPFPGHQDFPTSCQDCHNTIAWKPASPVDHPFPFTGAHANTPCLSCHVGNPPVYKGTPTECYGCHAADYASSPYPGHQGFPHTCDTCHNLVAWKPASPLNHPFPLDGKHATTACNNCHVGNPPVYKGTPSDCWSCHQNDYNSSPYPDHQTFSHTCTDCHTTNGWVPASGTGHPEDKFPIKSGKHSKFACADCHDASLGSTGKGNTNCIGCHTNAHTKSKMDSKHKDVKNYPANTSSVNYCLDCHPKGKH
ncbi:MAG: hypothetical protein KC776_08770 [Myxococcales bacterium]|nr:hypothetical protein [Myxococcales bacterium]MCB9576317.1 hypothetical protein [Polyangiaceae bacterium]